MITIKYLTLGLVILGFMILAYFIGKAIAYSDAGRIRVVRKRAPGHAEISTQCIDAAKKVKEMIDSGELTSDPLLFNSVVMLGGMVDGAEKANKENLVSLFTALYCYCITEQDAKFSNYIKLMEAELNENGESDEREL